MSSNATGPIVRMLATAGVFVLGVYGFWLAYLPLGGGGGVFAYAFDALQLVVGRFPENLSGRALPAPLQIARWGLPLLTLWTTVALAWMQIRNPVRLRLVRLRGEHLVIAGDEGLAAMTVRGERKAGRAVMLWIDDPAKPWVQQAGDLGVPNTPSSGATALGLDRARGLLLAGSDDAANVALAGKAMETALRVRAPGDPLAVIARIDDPDLRAPLENRFDWNGDRSLARLRFASLPVIAARRLFLRRPLDGFIIAGQAARRVYVLGFSATAEAFVLRLLAAGHFRDGGKPEIVVLDADAEHKRRIFHARRPGARTLADVVFRAAPVDEPVLVIESLGEAVAAHGPASAMIIDPLVPSRALPLALAVDAWFHTRGEIAPPIHVHMTDRAADNLGATIFPFGGLEEFADPELLLQRESDVLARAIHEFYLEGRLAEGDRIGSRLSMAEWDMLAEEVRDDNRLVADCYELKLRDIGARFVGGVGDGFEFTADELEQLARAEHDRWKAAKLLDGWTRGDVRDDDAKAHPDIVPYDDLDEPTKDLDREQIRMISRLAGRAGKRALRDFVIILAPGDAVAASFAAGVAAAMAGFAKRYPDRALVLLADFENPAAREAIDRGLEADALVEISLSANVGSTLAGLTRGERAAAAAAIRKADRLHAFPVEGWPAERRDAWLTARASARIASVSTPADDLPTVVLDAGGRIVGAPWDL